MAFISNKRGAPNGASEYEKMARVTAICALASLPLAFCAALTIWSPKSRPGRDAAPGVIHIASATGHSVLKIFPLVSCANTR